MKLPLYIILFLFGLAIAQSIYFYPLMPDIVGSHFNAAGKVNGASSKLGYFIIYFVSLAFTSSFSLVLPLLLKSLPTSLINLPHREYWLSGDQREASLQFLNVHFSWLGVATMLLMVVVFHITFLANLNPNMELNSLLFWFLLGAFLLFIIWWTVLLVRRFPKPL
jgi:uncharacterized membrane protein